MSIDAILAQLASMKDNAKDSIHTPIDKDFDGVWLEDIAAVDAATAILSALRDEGIGDPDQVRDMIQDYNSLAKQYQAIHQKYEEKAEAVWSGNGYFCPECHRQITGRYPYYCGNCGKHLGWR